MELTDITVPVLEAVGDFFSNDFAYVGGVVLVFVLIGVWASIQVRDWRKALRMKKEGDLELRQSELEIQQQILERLNDQSISEEERSVLLQQLSRPGRN